MNRKLTEKEVELENKSINRLIKELEEWGEKLGIMQSHKEFTKTKREYEDFIRPHNRKIEDQEIEGTLKLYNLEIVSRQKTIETLQDQIKNGVETKETEPPHGVG